MKMSPFSRKPFDIMACQVTAENLMELSALAGEVLSGDDEHKIVRVDPKRPNITKKIRVGDWVTQKDQKVRVYPDKTFREQFVPRLPVAPAAPQ